MMWTTWLVLLAFSGSVAHSFLCAGLRQSLAIRHRPYLCYADTSPSTSTQYTINNDVCPPVDPAELKAIVHKHCTSLETFLERKPIAQHTQAAFDQIAPLVDPSRPIILDSGCGTGRSTLLLGERYPTHTVIGVDRSFVRLNKHTLSDERIQHMPRNGLLGQPGRKDESASKRPFHQAVSSNVFLVRAELVDFWRCCLNHNHNKSVTDDNNDENDTWTIAHHFLLYPNPYPKKNRLKKRFYAHPSFPLILQIGGETITLRSNWEGYLREFAQCVEYAHEYYSSSSLSNDDDHHHHDLPLRETNNYALSYVEDARKGPVERLDKSVVMTNFEAKYDQVGERTYELKLSRRDIRQ